jgi:hypothetical protein
VNPCLAVVARTSRKTTTTKTGKACIELLGKAVQVDPIKPTLTEPGTKRLKLYNMMNRFQVFFQIQLAPLQLVARAGRWTTRWQGLTIVPF